MTDQELIQQIEDAARRELEQQVPLVLTRDNVQLCLLWLTARDRVNYEPIFESWDDDKERRARNF